MAARWPPPDWGCGTCRHRAARTHRGGHRRLAAWGRGAGGGDRCRLPPACPAPRGPGRHPRGHGAARRRGGRVDSPGGRVPSGRVRGVGRIAGTFGRARVSFAATGDGRRFDTPSAAGPANATVTFDTATERYAFDVALPGWTVTPT